MRVLSSSQLVSVLSLLAALGLVGGVLADPDHGSVWPQSGLSGLAVAKDLDAVLYLDTGDDLYVLNALHSILYEMESLVRVQELWDPAKALGTGRGGFSIHGAYMLVQFQDNSSLI